ncbi:MAG: DUF2851 family protein, partial [Bacteroidetes bacterium]|nr:DUF2851 family protein [Bacteroidota bacterium]
KQISIKNKLERRCNKENWCKRSDDAQVLYEMIASAFGAKINEIPFTMLAKELPIAMVHSLSLYEKQALFTIYSGLDVMDANSSATNEPPLDRWIWKNKGVRPSGRPVVRIKQFIHFIHYFPFDDLSQKSIDFKKDEYLKKTRIPISMINLINLNAIIPFHYIQQGMNENAVSTAINSLKKLPAEKNQLISFLKKAGLKIENAFDSQAFLELYGHFCKNKLCLECKIGNEILCR